MDVNVWGHHYSLSMGCQHAVNDLVGANPGTENVMYDFSGTCYLFLRNRVFIASSRRRPLPFWAPLPLNKPWGGCRGWKSVKVFLG